MRISMLSALCAAHLMSVAAAGTPHVVELFTSQGCSSCPPADALLGEFAGRADVIALAWHVDYWDNLGWPDKYADHAFTQRQARYATLTGRTGVFTPQAVVDGRLSLIGTDRSGLGKALAAPRVALVVSAHIEAKQLVVDVDAQSGREPVDVVLVSYLPESETLVAHGENGGHKLREFNIVRGFQRLGAGSDAAQRFTVALASLPADASRAAVLVQRVGQRDIVAATSVALR